MTAFTWSSRQIARSFKSSIRQKRGGRTAFPAVLSQGPAKTNAWARKHPVACPLWVKSGHVQRKNACPLYPPKADMQGSRKSQFKCDNRPFPNRRRIVQVNPDHGTAALWRILRGRTPVQCDGRLQADNKPVLILLAQKKDRPREAVSQNFNEASQSMKRLPPRLSQWIG